MKIEKNNEEKMKRYERLSWAVKWAWTLEVVVFFVWANVRYVEKHTSLQLPGVDQTLFLLAIVWMFVPIGLSVLKSRIADTLAMPESLSTLDEKLKEKFINIFKTIWLVLLTVAVVMLAMMNYYFVEMIFEKSNAIYEKQQAINAKNTVAINHILLALKSKHPSSTKK